MTYSVHSGDGQPAGFFEHYADAEREYRRRCEEPANWTIGWVAMLRDGEPRHYQAAECYATFAAARHQWEQARGELLR